ncbi:p-loop containing nucleoside triphosphate hydrolase [Diplodia corticola]|uniref:p-loop containing nucleoside triphosphate hydrolase n=1 Tax=Diplodia corticola TaxID=236234 RepID=A0A1J9RC51_9PEZI|nr:p-loop containing nucleoside triphosphate hydrolase [Diplodia corticola]OJD37738.1 p-loop containing nucleoside triphosphate hydrolase [Diplodia corticola]
MADPLTALGLASHAVQFIDSTNALIGKPAESYRTVEDDTLIRHPVLESITRSLVRLNDGIKFTVTRYREPEEVESRHQRVKQRLKHSKPTEKPVETDEDRRERLHEEKLIEIEEQLSNLCSDCNNVAQELLGALSDLKSRSKGTDTAWTTFRQALLTIWSEEDICSHAKILQQCQDRLGQTVLESLHEFVHFNAITYEDFVDDWVARTEKDEKRFEERIDELSRDQTGQPQDPKKLDALKKQRDEVLERHHFQREILKTFVRSGAKEDATFFSALLVETARKQKDETVERQVLEKLKFHDMRSRYQEISEAHKKTFEWVFVGTDHVQDSNGADHGRSKFSAPLRAPPLEARSSNPTPVDKYLTTTNGGTPQRGWWNTLLQRRFSDKNERPPDWDNYRTWLEKNSPLYWIKGKPGAGKSTLMKLLHDDERLKRYLQTWRGDSELAIMGFFFWNSGEVMQMSKEGLLRALLYQAVEQRPSLIPKLFPVRWAYNTQFGPDDRQWILPELERAFKSLVSDESRKYFIMIDGLDEYKGDPKMLAEFLLECSTNESHVKMCVSSQPLGVFETAFQGKPSLSLERLTEADIELYAKEQLSENRLFHKLQIEEPARIDKLIHAIAQKANGSFLWVQIVTGSLFEGFQEIDGTQELQARLQQYPPGLEELFDMTWSRIKEDDFEQSSRIFRLIQTADAPLSLLTIHYANEGPDKALDDNFRPLTPEKLAEIAEETRQQLHSLSGNMLDAPSFDEHGAWSTVQYIHKSVKEFLEKEDTRDSIRSGSVESDEEIKLALCTGYLRSLKKTAPSPAPPFERFQQLATQCLRFSSIIETEKPGKNLAILTQLDRAATSLLGERNPEREQWRRRIQSCVPLVSNPHWTNACPQRTGSSTFFDFAFLAGFYSYVENALREGEQHQLSSLLATAVKDERIDTKFVRLLLDYGADPNLHSGGATYKTPWYILLSSMSTGIDVQSNLGHDERVRLGGLAQLFLGHDADPFVTVRGSTADEVVAKAVGSADQELAGKVVALLDQSRKKNGHMKRKLNYFHVIVGTAGKFCIHHAKSTSKRAYGSDIAKLEAPHLSIPYGQQQKKVGPKHTSSFSWFPRLSTLENWWFFELLGVLGAAAALIGIIVVLCKYDDEPQPKWDGISLNSLVSWLSTVAKVCILMPVTKGLSQLKWVWFAEKDRPLSDIAVFDAASRGLVGSGGLLWHLKGRHFAVFGSAAIILSLGFDSFIQNLIHYYAKAVPDSHQVARLANASIYGSLGPGIGGNFYYVDPVLKSNVYSALFNTDPKAAWATPQYFCGTGNCDWGPVSTFAYCSTCSDVSESLQYSCPVGSDSLGKNCTVSLPNSGYSLWYRQMSPSFSNGVVMTMGPNTAKSNATSLTSIDSNTTFIGTECAIVPCVRSFNASVVNDTYREQDLGTWYGSNDSISTWMASHVDPPWGLEHGVRPGRTWRWAAPW